MIAPFGKRVPFMGCYCRRAGCPCLLRHPVLGHNVDTLDYPSRHFAADTTAAEVDCLLDIFFQLK